MGQRANGFVSQRSRSLLVRLEQSSDGTNDTSNTEAIESETSGISSVVGTASAARWARSLGSLGRASTRGRRRVGGVSGRSIGGGSNTGVGGRADVTGTANARLVATGLDGDDIGVSDGTGAILESDIEGGT